MRFGLALLAFLLAVPAAGAAQTHGSKEDAHFRHWLARYLPQLSAKYGDNDAQNWVYGYALVDLNGDGRNEAVVWARDAGFCGSGGCGVSIFRPTKSGWHLFADGPTTQVPIKLTVE